MKYLKLYEQLNKTQIGDYVICQQDFITKELEKFLSENVGQVIDYTTLYNYTIVKYTNIPRNIQAHFDNIHPNCRIFSHDEIIYNSPNIEDCEMFIEIFLSQQKYNL